MPENEVDLGKSWGTLPVPVRRMTACIPDAAWGVVNLLSKHMTLLTKKPGELQHAERPGESREQQHHTQRPGESQELPHAQRAKETRELTHTQRYMLPFLALA